MALIEMIESFAEENNPNDYEIYLDNDAKNDLSLSFPGCPIFCNANRFIGVIYGMPVFYDPDVWYCETRNINIKY
jgi:hypothetical protein